MTVNQKANFITLPDGLIVNTMNINYIKYDESGVWIYFGNGMEISLNETQTEALMTHFK